MNIHRKWRTRALATLGTGVAAGLTLWSAGVFDENWFARFKDKESPATDSRDLAESRVPGVIATPQAGEQGGTRRLHLVSTSPGRNEFEGTAALGEDVSNPQMMAVGAMLENGTILRRIYADHVVLERDGKRTELYIEGMAMPAHAKSAKPANGELLALADEVPRVTPSRVAPPTYTEILRGAPHYADDRLIGFDVYPGTGAGQFSRLGFKAGDLLTAIDGAPITDQKSLSEALKDLAAGRSVVASVIRAGQGIELTMDGAMLAQSAQAVASAAPMPP